MNDRLKDCSAYCNNNSVLIQNTFYQTVHCMKGSHESHIAYENHDCKKVFGHRGSLPVASIGQLSVLLKFQYTFVEKEE